MGPVGGRSADIAYRIGRHLCQLAEALERSLADLLPRLPPEDALDELLGLPPPHGGRRRRAQADPDLLLLRVEGQADGTHGYNHRVAGPDLGVLLRPLGLGYMESRYELVRLEGDPLGPGYELGHGDAAGALGGGQLHFGVRDIERGERVAGR